MSWWDINPVLRHINQYHSTDHIQCDKSGREMKSGRHAKTSEHWKCQHRNMRVNKVWMECACPRSDEWANSGPSANIVTPQSAV